MASELLRICFEKSGTKQSSHTTWHPVFGWFEQKSDKRYLICNKRYLICNKRYLICNKRYLICNKRYLICNKRYLISDKRYLICNKRYLYQTLYVIRGTYIR